MQTYVFTHIWDLIGTTTQGQSGLGSNENEGGTSYSSGIRNWSLTTRQSLVPQAGPPFCVFYFSARDTVSVFYALLIVFYTYSKDPFPWLWRTRHAGHCWRSKDELISDVLLWTPTYGRAKAGRPARTYIQQLCEDTGCNSEDLPEAMNDREKWRERVRDIRAGGTTWWWWWYITYPWYGYVK